LVQLRIAPQNPKTPYNHYIHKITSFSLSAWFF